MRLGRNRWSAKGTGNRSGPFCLTILAVLLLLAVGRLVSAETNDPATAAVSMRNMSERVDELLAQKWQSQNVEPAEPADDSELLRRLYLDLTGVIPRVAEVRAYLDDQRPEKKRELVDRLLESPAHATHLAHVWRDLLLPRKFDPEQTAGLVGLQNWLRRQFVDNKRYDRIVADLLVATGGDEAGPALFYTALGLKPEELGTTTARIFLGMRLDCAQCHKHPFDHWTQEDFWGYAAFFARTEQRSQNSSRVRLVDVKKGEAKLPDSETIVPTKYLGGSLADGNEGGTRRQQLAIWMVSRDNPYLARATVNLVWAQLFGRGLVEPLDDFGDHNPPSHPELLAELSQFFVRNDCNLRELYRTLVNTRAYQLSSRPKGKPEPAPELFAFMTVKTLTPEQLYDSLSRIALNRPAESQDPLSNPQRQAFLIQMQTQTRTVTDFETGVAQALTLMNGPESSLATERPDGGLLAALEAPFFDDEARVDTAFMATLARPPRDEEKARFVGYLQSSPTSDRSQAVSDVVWALLNSAEFTLNH